MWIVERIEKLEREYHSLFRCVFAAQSKFAPPSPGVSLSVASLKKVSFPDLALVMHRKYKKLKTKRDYLDE
jgi:hypothetical protein